MVVISGSKSEAEEMLPTDIDDCENAGTTYGAIQVIVRDSDGMKNNSEVENKKVLEAILLAKAIELELQTTIDIAEKTQQHLATQVPVADDSSTSALPFTNNPDLETENSNNNTSSDGDMLIAYTQANVSQDSSDGRRESNSSLENLSNLSSITATSPASRPIEVKGGGSCLASQMNGCLEIVSVGFAGLRSSFERFCQSSLGSSAVSNDANGDLTQMQDAAAAASSKDENELDRKEEELRQTDLSCLQSETGTYPADSESKQLMGRRSDEERAQNESVETSNSQLQPPLLRCIEETVALLNNRKQKKCCIVRSSDIPRSPREKFSDDSRQHVTPIKMFLPDVMEEEQPPEAEAGDKPVMDANESESMPVASSPGEISAPSTSALDKGYRYSQSNSEMSEIDNDNNTSLGGETSIPPDDDLPDLTPPVGVTRSREVRYHIRDLPPAFEVDEDHPPGWLMYRPEHGVITRERLLGLERGEAEEVHFDVANAVEEDGDMDDVVSTTSPGSDRQKKTGRKLLEGRVLTNTDESVEKLYSGNYSDVFVERKDGKQYVVKRIQKKKLPLRHLYKEVHALSCLGRHANIIHFIDECSDHRYLYIFLEFIPGGTLNDFVKRRVANKRPNKLPLHLWTFLMKQLADGLKHIHKQGVAHRDIKPDNLLMKGQLPEHLLCESRPKSFASNGGGSFQLKIADFGFSTVKEQSRTLCGSPVFMPPEMMDEMEEHDRCYYDCKAVDVWSTGVVGYNLLFGDDWYKNLKAGQGLWRVLLSIIGEKGKNDLKDALATSLVKDPNKRESQNFFRAVEDMY